MNFIEKNGLYIKLQKNQMPEADAALLKEKNPGSRTLNTRYLDSVRRSKEILLELIDYASYDEIMENREKHVNAKENQEDKEPVDLEKLTKKQLIEQYGEGLELSEKDNKADIIAAIEVEAKKKDSDLIEQETDQDQNSEGDQEENQDSEPGMDQEQNPEDSSPETDPIQNQNLNPEDSSIETDPTRIQNLNSENSEQ